MRIPRRIVAPLVRRSTYRRLTFLLLGSASAFGFASLGTIAAMFVGAPGHPVAAQVAAPIVLALPPMVGLGLLRSTVGIQRTLARALLAVPIGELPADAAGAVPWRHRWRSSGFFVLHVLAGYVVGLLLLSLAGFTALTVAAYVGPAGSPLPARDELRRLGPVVLIGAVVLLLYLAALLGAGFARLAAHLLGSTPEERLAALRHQVRELAERNRLARELHDSVGHALSVVTVQAAAAARVLDRDPQLARGALDAIADSARRALTDLDHVLGLLREEPTGTDPQWTLSGLDRLLTDVRAAGLTVRCRRTGDPTAVPAVVSREAYRIIQEGLTNALRHAGAVPVTLRVHGDGAGLSVEMSNEIAATGSGPAGGRGLTGIRERVALLGGTMTAGARDGRWVLCVRLPGGG